MKKCNKDDASSSIGENSCDLEDADDADEVQSSVKGPLGEMNSLEASLPIKRGLSQFYNGKSQSFTCLEDAVSSKDIVKSESPHARKFKILHAHSTRHRAYPRCNLFPGISKRTSCPNRGPIAAVAGMTELSTLGEEKQNLSTLPAFRSSAPKKSLSMTDLQAVGQE